MKKKNKFLILIIFIAMITLLGVVFFAIKYPTVCVFWDLTLCSPFPPSRSNG